MSIIVAAMALGIVAPEPRAGVAEPLAVKARAAKTTVRRNKPFDVRVRVVNASEATQTFRVMSHSWFEHWKTSNATVTVDGWLCEKNFPVTVTLKPGEAYEKTLPMLVTKAEPGASVSFKMGFTPIDSKQTYWSGKVTVQVEKAKAE
jgi:hypothetical protein